MKIKQGLKMKISIVTVSVMMLICFVQMIYFFYLSTLIKQQQEQNVTNYVYQISGSIEKSINVLKNVSSILSYNKYVQEYMEIETGARRIELKNYINNLSSSIQSINIDNVYMLLIDELGLKHEFDAYITWESNDKIMNLYDVYLEMGDNVSPFQYFFFQGRDDEVYLCCFVSINVINYDSLIKHRVGVNIVATKINLSEVFESSVFEQSVEFILENKMGDSVTLVKTAEGVSLFNMKEGEVAKKGYITKETGISTQDWMIRGRVMPDGNGTVLRSTQWLVLFDALILVALMTLINIFFNRTITSPIQKIIRFIEDYNVTNRKQRIEMPVGEEMGIIAEHINQMLDKSDDMSHRIFNTQQRLYEMELYKQEAVLYALQSQINPHFLYNTLECIRSIGMVHDIPEIVDISSAISEIFRYSIKGDGIVLVKDEVDIIKKYLKIMEIRFSDTFEIELNFSEEIMRQKILKMILQPIVENSFNHGLLTNQKTGKLSIEGRKEENVIRFYIRDNGSGISKDKYDEIIKALKNSNEGWDNKGSIGLANIDRRIKLYFGVQYGVEVDSVEGEYTEVSVTIPYENK